MNEHEVQKVRVLLGRTNPVPERVLDRAHERPAARDAFDRIVRTRPDPARRPLPREVRARAGGARGGLPLRVAVGVAAVTALAVGVLADPLGTPRAVADTPPLLSYGLVVDTELAEATGDEAAPVLAAFADAARARVEPPRTGDVQYVHVARWTFEGTTDAGGTWSAVVPGTVDTWVRPDGSLRSVERSGEPLEVGGRLPQGGAAPGPPEEQTFGPGASDAPTLDALAGLAPDVLRERLLDGTVCAARESTPDETAVCLLEGTARVQERAVVSGAVDGAIWSALAGEERLVTLGAVLDRAGRRTVAITVGPQVGAPVRPILLVDPADGALVGVERVLVDESAGYGVPAPAVVGFDAYLTRAWVDESG
ncbi:hypothetical protein ACWFNE_05505 [Cellulomonas sp. NPDC055163]